MSGDQNKFIPLAESLRPESVSAVIGQEDLLAPGKPLSESIAAGIAHSMVLWGPPGSGKTTLARIITQSFDAEMFTLSAVASGVKDIRDTVEKAQRARQANRRTVLFVDEVHRFNKSQQDAFLPHIESGVLIFIGATTENPAFELNSALLSRLKVYVLRQLSQEDLIRVLERALASEAVALPNSVSVTDEAKRVFAESAAGDARRALNYLEIAASIAGGEIQIDAEMAASVAGLPQARFDKRGDVFYEQISALHKSVRGSDPDAALYWLSRMLEGGCDPIFIARRVTRIASEDIGNADPRALEVALAAWDAYRRLGSPEGELAIAQAVVYMACTPKSNAVYKAFNSAVADAKTKGDLQVPMRLRNAPTRLQKEMGYGKGYRYAHDEPDGFASGETYFPDEMVPARYYEPVDRGIEKRIAEHMKILRKNHRQHIQREKDQRR